MSFFNSTVVSYAPITQRWSSGDRIVAVIATLFANLLAVVFNLLLISTIGFTRSLRNQPDAILIGNLALADFLVACCIMPFTTSTLVRNQLDPNHPIWIFIGFSNFYFCIASILNLAVLSLDQCLFIKSPFWYEIYRTKTMAFSIAACVWAYSFLCALPPLVGISSYACFIPNTGQCFADQWSSTHQAIVFAVVVVVFSWGFGIIILAVSNISIYFVIVKQRKAIRKTMVHDPRCPKSKNLPGQGDSKGKTWQTQHVNRASSNIENERAMCHSIERATSTFADSQEAPVVVLENDNIAMPNDVSCPTDDGVTNAKRKKMERRIRCNCFVNTKHVKSLLIIVIAYFISWSPFCILLLIEIETRAKEYPDLSLVFLWIGHTSSFINPALYFYRYNRFRDALKMLSRRVFNHTRIRAV